MSNEFDLTDPDFVARAREVRRALDNGEPMSLGDIADRLGMSFQVFTKYMAGEIFQQFDDIEGVMAEGELIVRGAVH